MHSDYFDPSLLQLLTEPAEASALLGNLLWGCNEHSIFATDTAARIVLWSPGAARTYGRSADEVLGRCCADILRLTDDTVQLYQRALRDGEVETTIECVRPSGERLVSRVLVWVRRNAAGEPTGLVLSNLDASDQRRAMEATRTKQNFLANMSHELRTPLNAIIGFSELLYDGKVGELETQHRQYLSHVLTSSRQLLQLINDILDLAKIEAGQLVFAADHIDVGRAAHQVRDVLCAAAAKKRLQVSIDVDPCVGTVIGDGARLKQILYSYLSNAIKFTPEGGCIRIRIQLEGNDAFCLSVEDTGVGVRPEDLTRLFVEFQQLDLSTAKLHQGAGLGLALTRRMVEAQGGSVDVRSTPGRGSTFSATLPRRPATLVDELPALDPSVRSVALSRSESR